MFCDVENGGRARWNDEDDKWIIPRLEFTDGSVFQNGIKNGYHGMQQPELDYTRTMRKSNPTNLRFRRENVINLGLEMPDRTTQEYDGSGVVSNVSEILEMHWNYDETDGGDGDHIPFPRDFPRNPYHRFGDEEVSKSCWK